MQYSQGVCGIVRLIDRKVSDGSRFNGLEPDLVEEICRVQAADGSPACPVLYAAVQTEIMPNSSDAPVPRLPLLFSRTAIQARVAEMGAAITRDLAGDSVVLVGVLKGAAIFLADLAREIQADCTFDFMSVSSYGKGTTTGGQVRLLKDLDESIEDRNVILVEDILDTGLTLSFLRQTLERHHPRSLKIAALLDKPERRLQPIEADYVGFRIPDRFVVGYGMDFSERYRNLPDICLLPEPARGVNKDADHV